MNDYDVILNYLETAIHDAETALTSADDEDIALCIEVAMEKLNEAKGIAEGRR
jgi:hypothetical protein